MLESLFGNRTVENIFFYLLVYGDGYAKQLADLFSIPINGIQQQLKRLEDGGIVVNQMKGRTRVYQFNPRYPFLIELKTLLNKAMRVLPESEIAKYYCMRTRPRRKGKP